MRPLSRSQNGVVSTDSRHWEELKGTRFAKAEEFRNQQLSALVLQMQPFRPRGEVACPQSQFRAEVELALHGSFSPPRKTDHNGLKGRKSDRLGAQCQRLCDLPFLFLITECLKSYEFLLGVYKISVSVSPEKCVGIHRIKSN